MPNEEHRTCDRRAIIERRNNLTGLMNGFIEQYGPERRIKAERRDLSDRRR